MGVGKHCSVDRSSFNLSQQETKESRAIIAKMTARCAL